MKSKLVSLLLASLLVLSLAGCGSKTVASPTDKLTLDWDGYNLSYDGKVLNVTEHRGTSIEIATDIGAGGLLYTITIDESKDATNITLNTQGILEENMEKLKSMFYYQEYLGSKTTGMISLGNNYWIVGQALTNNVNTPVAMISQYLYEYLTTLPVTASTLYVNCGDKFTFGSEWYEILARPDKCLVKDVIQVLPGQVMPKMEPYNFIAADGSSRSGLYGETETYQYYYYEGYTIQCSKGVDIYEFISIK